MIAEGRSSRKKAQKAQEKAPFYHLLRILRLFAAGSAIGSETTDFADATDQDSIPFVRCCKDRAGQPGAEVDFPGPPKDISLFLKDSSGSYEYVPVQQVTDNAFRHRD